VWPRLRALLTRRPRLPPWVIVYTFRDSFKSFISNGDNLRFPAPTTPATLLEKSRYFPVRVRSVHHHYCGWRAFFHWGASLILTLRCKVILHLGEVRRQHANLHVVFFQSGSDYCLTTTEANHCTMPRSTTVRQGKVAISGQGRTSPTGRRTRRNTGRFYQCCCYSAAGWGGGGDVGKKKKEKGKEKSIEGLVISGPNAGWYQPGY